MQRVRYASHSGACVPVRHLLTKVGRGLYRLPDAQVSEFESLGTIATKVPQAVFCLLTALQFHELTTQLPRQTWIAMPRRRSGLRPICCASGRNGPYPPVFSLHRMTMRLKNGRICPRFPPRLATIAQVRQPPRVRCCSRAGTTCHTGPHATPICWVSVPVIWGQWPKYSGTSQLYRSTTALRSTQPPSRSRRSARKLATVAFA